jgi:septum site-determining protein MinD
MTLAVTAGKGGVGKSTVAYNLGAELDAVVVDADLGMADLPAGRGPDLHDVLAGRADALEAVHEAGPVALLPCGRSLAGARAADATALGAALAEVGRHYGEVVVDCPAGLGGDAGVALLAAEACLVVTRPTEPALAGAVRSRELARVLGTPLARVVLNRAGSAATRPVADALGAPVTTVPESDALARAQRAGQPVAAVAPESRATEQFRALAAAVRQPSRSSV